VGNLLDRDGIRSLLRGRLLGDLVRYSARCLRGMYGNSLPYVHPRVQRSPAIERAAMYRARGGEIWDAPVRVPSTTSAAGWALFTAGSATAAFA
jgi:hypothetical protein